MKFQHLKIGQKFRYQGETYLKSTPLIAHHAETDVQKLIPRYAEIEPVIATVSVENPSSSQPLSNNDVRTAIEQYHELCLLAIEESLSKSDATALRTLQVRLGAVYKQILHQLNLE